MARYSHIWPDIARYSQIWPARNTEITKICRYSEKFRENKDIHKSAWKCLIVPCGRAGSASNNEEDQDILVRGSFLKLIRASRSMSR